MTHRIFFHPLLTSLALWPIFGLCLLSAACVPATGKPTVVIESPPHGSQYHAGDTVAVQSTSTDPAGVTFVDLIVDDVTVRTDAVPGANGQFSFTCIQTWKATPGTHSVSVRARNAAGVAGDPATISISVLPAATPGPTTSSTPPTVSPVPSVAATPSRSPSPGPPACTDAAAFVADVSIPGGTIVGAGQVFNKVWRMRNTGTCTWGAGYQLVFISGAPMTTTTLVAVANTAPGAVVDLTVTMTAPPDPGYHSGRWQMRSPAGVLFGETTSLVIVVQAISAAPTNFTAAGSGTTIAFTWLDASTDESGFRLYQVGVAAPVATFDAHAGTGGMAFNWTNRPCNLNASFYIRAFNPAGESASSTIASALTVPCAPDLSVESATPQGSLYVNLTDNSSTESGFRIYRSDSTLPIATLGARPDVGIKGATAVGPFPCGSRVLLSARAFNSAGESTPSVTVEGATLPCQVGVTFTGVDILSTALSKPGPAHVRLKFSVNGQVQYWPSATGYQEVNVGDAKTFTLAFSLLLMRDTNLNLKVEGTESEYNPSIQQTVQSDIGTVEKTFTGAVDWGKGSHADESTRGVGSYRIHYTIAVTP